MNVFRLASTTGLRYDYSYCIISIICWVSFHCFRFCSVLAKEKEIYLHYYTRKIICRKVVMPSIRIEFTPLFRQRHYPTQTKQTRFSVSAYKRNATQVRWGERWFLSVSNDNHCYTLNETYSRHIKRQLWYFLM